MVEFKKNVFWTCQRILLYHNQKGIRGAINRTIFVFLCFYCTWFWVFSFTFANRRAYDPSVVSFCVQIIKWHSIKIYQEKKMILWLGVQYLHWRKQEREFEAFDIGTKAKLMFANSTFFPVEKQTKVRKDCLKFYVATVQHLQSKLPLDIPFIRYAQFLHPKKRQLPGATSAISNLAVSTCSVHKTCLQDVCLTKSPVTREEVCDMARNQWFTKTK